MGKNIANGNILQKASMLFKRIIPSIYIRPDGVSISAKYDQTSLGALDASGGLGAKERGP
jgi:hypothetical protein